MKKAVLKLDVHGDKEKNKAMKTVSGLPGVDSISMNMKDKKLTVIGDIDPVTIVSKLRKLFHTEMVSVGPAKEPEKKEEDPKKEEPKKDDKKKDETIKDDVSELVKAYKAINPHMTTIERMKVDITATLPAEWICHIISLTTPRDACRLAAVCPFFKSLADSDSVWENFLPLDYREIISDSVSSSSLITSLSKKDLYFHLCRNPVAVKTGLTEAVLKHEIHDDKEKQKVVKTLARLPWMKSITLSMKDKKLTLTGDTDPVTMASKLREQGFTEIVSLRPEKKLQIIIQTK